MYEFLKKVPLFAGLPDEDLRQICGMVDEVRLAEGEELFAEGSPGDKAYIIQEGQLEIIKSSSGREVLLAVRDHPGDVIGEMALLEEAPRMASVRARRASVLLAIPKEQFDHLVSTSLSAANAMFNTILDRWRNTEARLRQSERMAQLGTLTAGVAHELNNPAAAVKRGAAHLQTAAAEFGQAQLRLGQLTLTPPQAETLAALAETAQAQALRPPELDALARSDREAEFEDWLDGRGVEGAWELAPALVDLNLTRADLEQRLGQFAPDQLPPVIAWLKATYAVHNLLAEIGQGASRISEIVKALKSYSYLDQAPVQAVDIHEGLDNTLLILRHKLQAGIQVRRDYAPDLPKINGYGSELNQVWTNVIDNAADAMKGQGELRLRTRREDDAVIVEIEDNGPGIPPEIQPRIFDPFFTTKPPGEGTGLGLDITYNIVVHKHRGEIKVTSEPGRTCFQIWLPINFEAR